MRDHPDDAAYLDSLTWTDGRCEVCRHTTTEPTAIHANMRLCRDDLAYRLHLDRHTTSGASA